MTATLPRTPVPAARWAWARERYSKGDPNPVIARRLGVSPQAVQRHMERHGLPRRYKVDRGVAVSGPRRWRCAEHARLCTPEARCGCVQPWEAA